MYTYLYIHIYQSAHHARTHPMVILEVYCTYFSKEGLPKYRIICISAITLNKLDWKMFQVYPSFYKVYMSETVFSNVEP
jgi:hypothetical protein